MLYARASSLPSASTPTIVNWQFSKRSEGSPRAGRVEQGVRSVTNALQRFVDSNCSWLAHRSRRLGPMQRRRHALATSADQRVNPPPLHRARTGERASRPFRPEPTDRRPACESDHALAERLGPTAPAASHLLAVAMD